MIEKMRLGRTEAVTRRLNLAKAVKNHEGVSLLQKARYGRLEALCARHGDNVILFRGQTRVPPLRLTPAHRVMQHVPMSLTPTHAVNRYLVQ
jgi:hypothetical protein